MKSATNPMPRPSPRTGVAVSSRRLAFGHRASTSSYVVASAWCASSTITVPMSLILCFRRANRDHTVRCEPTM